jgi:hypothetical protein
MSWLVIRDILAVEPRATGADGLQHMPQHPLERSALCYLENTIINRQDEPDVRNIIKVIEMMCAPRKFYMYIQSGAALIHSFDLRSTRAARRQHGN